MKTCIFGGPDKIGVSTKVIANFYFQTYYAVNSNPVHVAIRFLRPAIRENEYFGGPGKISFSLKVIANFSFSNLPHGKPTIDCVAIRFCARLYAVIVTLEVPANFLYV